MNAILRALKDPNVSVTIQWSPFRVGTAPDNQLHLRSTAVSAQHAIIEEISGQLVINDQNSAQGTFVNGVRVQRAYITDGDVISFGTEEFRLLRARDHAKPSAPRSEQSASSRPAQPPISSQPQFSSTSQPATENLLPPHASKAPDQEKNPKRSKKRMLLYGCGCLAIFMMMGACGFLILGALASNSDPDSLAEGRIVEDSLAAENSEGGSIQEELFSSNDNASGGEVEFDNLQKPPSALGGAVSMSPYIIVDDADSHYARAVATGAEIVIEVRDEDYGGRGYSCRDPEGHVWSFGSYDPWASA